MSFSEKLVRQNNLQPADVVVVKSSNGLGVLDHYMVYVGSDELGQPLFMANFRPNGVTYLYPWEIEEYAGRFHVDRIRKFHGTLWQRKKAIQRAHSSHGKKYSLFSQNCEHFANYVQTNRAFSLQSQKAGWSLAGLAAVGLLVAFSGNKDKD